ncbi:MAG: hypothetical protein HOP28_07100, partial [Gemmatimonadales bacterium]|nr:hypothetical protein [Gemmatimonadales bacterium]
MAAEAQFRCDVAGPEALRALRDAPLPGGLRGGPPVQSFHRDIYLDTPDRSLFRRGVSCRVRIGADDRRTLTVILGGTAAALERFEADVPELDPRQALEAGSEPARRLRGLVDPALLRPRLELEVERWSRAGTGGFLVRRPRFAFFYDACTVRHGGLSRTFEELTVRRVADGGPSLLRVAGSLERSHGLRPLVLPRHERAAQLVESLSAEAAARRFQAETSVVLIAIDEGNVAFLPHEEGKALPFARGSGEEAARHLLGRVTGSRVGALSLAGSLHATEERDALEVWVARRIRGDGDTAANLIWLPLADAAAKIGTPEIRAPETLAALAVAARSSLIGAPGREPAERFAP